MQIISIVFLLMEQKILIFKLLITISLILYSSASFSEKIIEGKAKIIDGDTIHIEKNKIRLHGIDAPEIDQTCTIKNKMWHWGLESSAALKKLVLDNNISCVVSDIDKYKRYIAECFINNKNINKFMVRNGWAIAYQYYSLDFVEDENLAKKDKIGLWQGKFQEPYLYRKTKKN